MGCGASSSAQASAPSALEGTAREDNASRTPGLQRDPATGNTSAVEDPLEKAAREAKQTFDARQQRLQAGLEASSPVAGSQVPMYTQIGHEIARHARGQWKEKLEAPLTLDSKPRNAVKDMLILRVHNTRDVCLHIDLQIYIDALSNIQCDQDRHYRRDEAAQVQELR